MQYLCIKQLVIGGVTYIPGSRIPEGVILPERSSKLIRNGYISKLDETSNKQNEGELFTQEQVEQMLSEAVEEAVNNTIVEMEQQKGIQEGVTELKGIELEAFMETVLIDIVMESGGEDEQHMAVPAKAEEIKQVFFIMQLNADEGVKMIADVRSENVLILLHAADSRKTIKDAAKKQADKLFSIKAVPNESTSDNESIGANMEGADT